MAFSCYLSQVDCLCVDVTSTLRHRQLRAPTVWPALMTHRILRLALLIKFLLALLPSVGDSSPIVRRSQKGEFAFLLARGKSLLSTNIF